MEFISKFDIKLVPKFDVMREKAKGTEGNGES